MDKLSLAIKINNLENQFSALTVKLQDEIDYVKILEEKIDHLMTQFCECQTKNSVYKYGSVREVVR